MSLLLSRRRIAKNFACMMLLSCRTIIRSPPHHALVGAWVMLPPSRFPIPRRSVSCHAMTSSNTLILPSHSEPIQTVMAPMVAASDYAFRCLVEQHGADLTFTQMLHARNLVQDPTFRTNHVDFPFSNDGLTKSQQECVEGMPQSNIRHQRHDSTPGPLIVQLAGHDPELMVRAFDILLQQDCEFAGVDINLGCPQAIARKGLYGAFLHEQQEELVCRTLTRLRQHLPASYSVSCKIRLPRSLDDQDIKNRIQRLVETGIDFMTVHGRTLEENKTKTGSVHADKISLAVETAGNIPVIANGGIEHHVDIETMMKTTNAAAVMSSEALLETPNLFTTDSTLLSSHKLFQQQVGMARDYIQLCTLYPPLPGVLGGFGSFSIVKGHLFKMLHRYLQQHEDIRDQLTSSTKLVHALDVLDELDGRYNDVNDYETCPSSQTDASWYRRHWAANNRVHQRRKTLESREPKSVEERKEEMKQRIAKLRQERLAKNDDRVAV